MAGLFSSSEQDMLSNIVQQRQQANQALASPYGKYGGIVQAGAQMADIGADAMFGGKTGASDPRMQQMNEIKNIFAQVSMEVGDTSSAAFYSKMAQALSAKYPEQAQKAADKAMEIWKKQADISATKALAAQRNQLKDRSTAAERNRQAIVELEVKLQSNQELTPREIAVARYLLAQESKPKSWTDKETGEVVTVEAFDVNSAAPNVAKLLGKDKKEGETSGVTTTATPASNKIKEHNIKSLERSIGDIEGDLRNVDKATQLTGFLTTGRIGALVGAVDPGSEARALEEALGSIKAATAFNSLRSLREASKSGSSGLGQVTEVEFKALQDRMTSLRKESPTYKADLAYIKAKWTELKERAMNDLAALRGEKLPFPNVKSVGEKYEESPGEATGKVSGVEVGKPIKIGNIEVRRIK